MIDRQALAVGDFFGLINRRDDECGPRAQRRRQTRARRDCACWCCCAAQRPPITCGRHRRLESRRWFPAPPWDDARNRRSLRYRAARREFLGAVSPPRRSRNLRAVFARSMPERPSQGVNREGVLHVVPADDAGFERPSDFLVDKARKKLRARGKLDIDRLPIGVLTVAVSDAPDSAPPRQSLSPPDNRRRRPACHRRE